MKEIKLTRGMVALVDDRDYDFLIQWKWHANPSTTNGCFYARRTIRVGKGVKRIYMHRLIMQADSGIKVDHIDRNGLNNQRSNLRLCTRQQNTFNTNNRKRKSPYKGVSKKEDYDRKKPWRACFKANGKQMLFGHFETEIEAAICYDINVLKFRGEFAVLNFPERYKNGVYE